MSENGQNEYFQDLQYFNYDYNNQFPINHSPVENSPFKELNMPLQVWDQQPQTQKPDVKPTESHNPPPQNQPIQAPNPDNCARSEVVFESSAVQQHRSAVKGSKDDTVQLNVHFKTILVNYLKESVYANELDGIQIAQIKHFVKRAPSFKSLKELLMFKGEEGQDNVNLRRVCLEFAKSTEFMRRILCTRSGLGPKLQMIKYIERLEMNLKRKEIVKWKEETKRPNKFQS